MLTKEEIIKICRDSLTVTELGEDRYSFKLYFETVADKISSRLDALVRQGVFQPMNFAGLEDKAAMFLELLNISGDAMVDLDHNVPDGKEGAMYLHDIMAAFVEDLSKISA